MASKALAANRVFQTRTLHRIGHPRNVTIGPFTPLAKPKQAASFRAIGFLHMFRPIGRRVNRPVAQNVAQNPSQGFRTMITCPEASPTPGLSMLDQLR